MWIWELPQLRGRRRRRDRRPRPRRRHLDRVRQELRRRREPLGAVQPRPRRGAARQRPARLRLAVRLRQRPAGEASLGVDAVADGADCLVIDAESQYEGKYAAAQQYVAALRAAVGPAYPIGLTSFPYVDYHPRLPYSVFLGPGGAQANLPQVYWKDIGGTVDAVSGHTLAPQPHLRRRRSPRSARPTATRRPRTSRASARCGRPTAAPGCPGGRGRRPARPSGACSPSRSRPFPPPPPDPGWPALAKGNKGDQVVWLQQHLASFDPAVTVTSTFDAATDTALRNFQTSRGLPVTGDDRRADLAGRPRPAAAAGGLDQEVGPLHTDRPEWAGGPAGEHVERPPPDPRQPRHRAIRWSRGQANASRSFWKTAFSARAPKP